MTRITSGWMVQGGSPNVIVLTFALSRPTTTTMRPTSRWRRCRTSSPRGRARARAPQRRRRSLTPRRRRRPRLLRRPQREPRCPSLRRRPSTPLRRRRRTSWPPLRTPQQRRPLPQPQLQPQTPPQPHAVTHREIDEPHNASLNIARSPTEMATSNSPMT